MRERKDVYKLPEGDTTLEWYGKAVIKMKSLPSTDPRSWNYQAAMHGFSATNPFWSGVGTLPPLAERNKFWNQCQHGSWFFLPWHRMYLAYFEQIVAQTIVDLGGPADWALPFWNYSDTTNPDALNIPPAFTSPASSSNGLWMRGRRNNTLNGDYVGLEPLDTIPYTGDGITSQLGFGGPETGFSHGGSIHGDLEGNIHDNVHVMIGGAMGNPNTAGLDPIFWLHHANIDRLWQVWLNRGVRTNPKKSSWLNFAFNFHDKDGNAVTMIPKNVEDTQTVLSGYTYQGVPADTGGLESMDTAALKDFSLPLEVMAASNTRLSLGDTRNVQLEMMPSRKKTGAEGGLESVTASKTTILHLENITGQGVPPIHNVYINLPANAVNKKAYYAGAVSFFGVEMASTPSTHEAGSGQHYAINISKLLNTLRTQPGWNEEQLNIQFEPTEAMDSDTSVSIGRISLYSE